MGTYKIKSRLWLEQEGESLMGEGTLLLLKTIDEEGSLSKAAQKLNLSYKKAWKLADNLNKTSNNTIITKQIGGKNGGGMQITEYGRKLIAKFEEIRESCWAFLNEKQEELNRI